MVRMPPAAVPTSTRTVPAAAGEPAGVAARGPERANTESGKTESGKTPAAAAPAEAAQGQGPGQGRGQAEATKPSRADLLRQRLGGATQAQGLRQALSPQRDAAGTSGSATPRAIRGLAGHGLAGRGIPSTFTPRPLGLPSGSDGGRASLGARGPRVSLPLPPGAPPPAGPGAAEGTSTPKPPGTTGPAPADVARDEVGAVAGQVDKLSGALQIGPATANAQNRDAPGTGNNQTPPGGANSTSVLGTHTDDTIHTQTPAEGSGTADRAGPVASAPPPPGRPAEQHQVMETLVAQGPLPPARNKPKELAVASVVGRDAAAQLQNVVDEALSRIVRAGAESRSGQEDSRLVRVALYRADQIGVSLV